VIGFWSGVVVWGAGLVEPGFGMRSGMGTGLGMLGFGTGRGMLGLLW